MIRDTVHIFPTRNIDMCAVELNYLCAKFIFEEHIIYNKKALNIFVRVARKAKLKHKECCHIFQRVPVKL